MSKPDDQSSTHMDAWQGNRNGFELKFMSQNGFYRSQGEIVQGSAHLDNKQVIIVDENTFSIRKFENVIIIEESYKGSKNDHYSVAVDGLKVKKYHYCK